MIVDSRNEQPVQRVKDLVLQYFEGRNVRIYLFGSWARGEQKRSSDIDIAIESRDDISYELTLLRERLEESTISRQVDVVDMQSCRGRLVPAHPTGGNLMERLTERYRLAIRAFGKFHELAIRDTLSEIERDALIQRFEFSFD